MTIHTKSIERKRADAFVRVGQNVLGTSLAAAIPTPALELTKTIGIAAADAWMFYDIYKIYYDEKLSSQRLQELLGNAGVIIMTGGAVSYGAIKISQGLLSEFLNTIPLLGWAISGAMSGTSSLILGLGWMAFIEAQYQLSTEADSDASTEDAPSPATILNKAEEIVEDAIHTTRQAVQNTVASVKNTVKEATNDTDIIPDDDGKILAQHPEGKRSLRVDADKYVLIRDALVKSLHEAGGETTLDALLEAVEAKVGSKFEGSVRWYVNTVKLDLEARKLIERVPDEAPQKLRFT